ncbi:MAG: hypothetical protein H6697_11280 [Myxococcales bacterium]|nr:hypothetical protein [Myxococcales bacterium]MCB9521282.1 hypothetical protein [Myxococcales bacterium]
MSGGRPTPRGSVAVAALLLSAACVACGGYAQRLEAARVDVERSALDDAASRLDALVARAEEGRGRAGADLPLLLLERAAIAQGRGDHRQALADLQAADQLLEVLDLSNDRGGQAANYLWSGSRALYRPPVYEKLMVNVLAAASYLALDDRQGARVEARRIGVLLDYFADTPLAEHPMLGGAAFVAGLAMEVGGEVDEAARFYGEAWRLSRSDLARARLGCLTPSAAALRVESVAAARDGVEQCRPRPEGTGDVVVLAFSGLPPYRIAERLPIGIVFAVMRQDAAYSFGVREQATYDRILAEGLLTWVNFPSLVVREVTSAPPPARVGGQVVHLSGVADVAAFALAEWEADRPGIAFAALTRMITRVLAREAVQAAGGAGGDTAETVGFLLGLATEGAMQAADTPDTRTWTLMPAAVWATSTSAPVGAVPVQLGAGPQTASVSVDVRDGATTVAVVRLF